MNIYSHTTNIQLGIYPHQLSSLDFLLSNKQNNVLVYQKMGYGKTMIGCLLALIRSNDIDNMIYIICPNNTVLEIWSIELIKAKQLLLYKHNLDKIVLITLYQFNDYISSNMHNDELPKWIIDRYNNSLFIIDEAHKILLNNSEQIFLKLRNEKCNFKLVLITATPIINTPETLISLIRLISEQPEVDRNLIYVKGSLVFENKLVNSIETLIDEYFYKSIIYYFPTIEKNLPKKIEMGEYIKPYTSHTLIPCVMNGLQLNVYNDIVNTGDNNMFLREPVNAQFYAYKRHFTTRDINSIMIKAKGSPAIVKDLFDKSMTSDSTVQYSNKLKCMVGSIFTGKALKKTSIKFYTLFSMINDIGKSLLFFQNVEYGSHIVRSIMSSNGFVEYGINFYPENGLCTECNVMLKNHNNNTHEFNQAKFIILTGSKINSSGDHIELINIVNSETNRDGYIIKYVFISEAFSVAYSFFNFDSIHILTPRNTENELAQTLARVIRKSMTIKKQKNVKIYLYCAMLPNTPVYKSDAMKYLKDNSNKLSVDFKRYLYSELKNEQILIIEKAMSKISSVEYLKESSEYVMLLHKALLLGAIYKERAGMSFKMLNELISKYNPKVKISIEELNKLLQMKIVISNNQMGDCKIVEICPGVISIKPIVYVIKSPLDVYSYINSSKSVWYSKPLNDISLIRYLKSGIIKIKIGNKPGIGIESIHKQELLNIYNRVVKSKDMRLKSEDIVYKKDVISKILDLFEKLKSEDKSKTYIVEII